MMRTLTTLLLLVCFAWSQAAAADCRQASGPGGASDVHAADAHAHHHEHHAPAPAGDDDDGHPHGPPAHHTSTGCGVLSSCGAAAAPRLPTGPTAAFAQAGHGLGAGRGAYIAPTLSTEPPPPRVALRS